MDCGSSKRGRGHARSKTTAATTKKKEKATTKKKEKGAVTKPEEAEAAEVVVVEGAGGLVVAEEVVAEELWSGVDEGMPWATCWFPFWEVEASLYGDVWDYDIWGLKAANNMPPNH